MKNGCGVEPFLKQARFDSRSARNLRVSNCSFINTSGTPPMSGIDLEPDVPWVGPRVRAVVFPACGLLLQVFLSDVSIFLFVTNGQGSCATTPPSGICNRLENITLEALIIRQNPGSGISVGPGRLGAGAPVPSLTIQMKWTLLSLNLYRPHTRAKCACDDTTNCSAE